jgi:hypothetical protein
MVIGVHASIWEVGTLEMTDRRLRIAALGVGALTVALVAATVVLVLTTGGRAANQYDQPWAEVTAAVTVLAGTAAGLVIILRRPHNRIAWIVLAPGFTLALEDLAAPAIVTTHVIRDSPSLATEVFAVVSDALWLPSLGLGVAGLFLLFPDGRFIGPRSRWTFRVAAVGSAAFAAATLLTDAPLYALATVTNPLGIPGTSVWLEPVQGLGVLTVAAAAVTGLGCLVIRWRRSVGRERAQLKWFVAASSLVPAALIPVGIIDDPSGTSGSSWGLLVELAMMAPLVAIAVAILRHNLYGIDRMVSRTVTYTVVTATLVGVYAGLVVVLQAVLSPLAADSDLAVAGSTLVVVALFRPVVRRARQVVDRRFDRSAYDAARTAERFGQSLRDQVDLDTVATELRRTVSTTIQPTTVSVWLVDAKDGR